MTCNRCGHKWKPKVDHAPKKCPACTSPYWNKPRIKSRRDDTRARRR